VRRGADCGSLVAYAPGYTTRSCSHEEDQMSDHWQRRANHLLYAVATLDLDPVKDKQHLIAAVDKDDVYFGAFPYDRFEKPAAETSPAEIERTESSLRSSRSATIVEAVKMLHEGTFNLDGPR
jgi:hypothetical protein